MSASSGRSHRRIHFNASNWAYRSVAMSKRSYVCQSLLFVVLLSGCAMPGSWDVWVSTASSKPTDGALNVGDARPPVLSKSKVVLSPYENPNTYAFTDSAGRYINVFDTLLKDLDSYSQRVSPLRPWITNVGTKEFREGREYPFKMFLLTISPEVVLVVPTNINSGEDGCRTLFLQGCLQSQSFRGGAYWFRGSPKISEGSYWFSPSEGDARVHPLDAASETNEIRVDGAILRLSKSNSEWSVDRLQ